MFSIVIPAYNSENTISRCIKSIQSTRHIRLEVIVVDDGSTDCTAEAALEALEGTTHDRLVLHQENKGAYAARRAGYRASHGEYVLSLDSDDTLAEGAIDHIFDALETNNWPDLLLFAGARDHTGIPFTNLNLPLDRVLKEDELMKVRELAVSSMELNNLSLKCFRRSLLVFENHMESGPNLRRADDAIQSLAIIDRAKSVVAINDILYNYLSNPESLTNTANERYLSDVSVYRGELLYYADRWEIPNGIELVDTLLATSVYRMLKTPASGPDFNRAFSELLESDLVKGILAHARTDRLPINRRLVIWTFQKESPLLTRAILAGERAMARLCALVRFKR